MNNREKIERLYNDIHASEALKWKVMNMNNNMDTKKYKTRKAIKYCVCALAAAMLIFAASNGICYAASGESLVTKIKITVNGEEKQEDIKWTKDGDTYKGNLTIESEDGSVATITLGEEAENYDIDFYTETEKEDENGIEESFNIEIKNKTLE